MNLNALTFFRLRRKNIHEALSNGCETQRKTCPLLNASQLEGKQMMTQMFSRSLTLLSSLVLISLMTNKGRSAPLEAHRIFKNFGFKIISPTQILNNGISGVAPFSNNQILRRRCVGDVMKLTSQWRGVLTKAAEMAAVANKKKGRSRTSNFKNGSSGSSGKLITDTTTYYFTRNSRNGGGTSRLNLGGLGNGRSTKRTKGSRSKRRTRSPKRKRQKPKKPKRRTPKSPKKSEDEDEDENDDEDNNLEEDDSDEESESNSPSRIPTPPQRIVPVPKNRNTPLRGPTKTPPLVLQSPQKTPKVSESPKKVDSSFSPPSQLRQISQLPSSSVLSPALMPNKVTGLSRLNPSPAVPVSQSLPGSQVRNFLQSSPPQARTERIFLQSPLVTSNRRFQSSPQLPFRPVSSGKIPSPPRQTTPTMVIPNRYYANYSFNPPRFTLGFQRPGRDDHEYVDVPKEVYEKINKPRRSTPIDQLLFNPDLYTPSSPGIVKMLEQQRKRFSD